MIKNVTVFDSEGNFVSMTYPRRAAGLVKKGRARYTDSAETAIILARSPDIVIASEEDETQMSNFNFDEYREKLEAMWKVASEKLDAVSKTAADIIDDAVARIKNGEEKCSITFDEDGEVSITVGDDVPSEEEREQFGEAAEEAADEVRAETERRREAFAKLVADAKETVSAAVAEASVYMDAAKTKLTEKISEMKEARAARAEAEEAEEGDDVYGYGIPVTDEIVDETEQAYGKRYYLDRIRDLQYEDEHIREAIQKISDMAATEGLTAENLHTATEAVKDIVSKREESNRQVMDFYIGEIAKIDAEAEKSAKQDAEPGHETADERRARLISNDPIINGLLKNAVENGNDPGEAMGYITEYIIATYGDPS